MGEVVGDIDVVADVEADNVGRDENETLAVEEAVKEVVAVTVTVIEVVTLTVTVGDVEVVTDDVAVFVTVGVFVNTEADAVVDTVLVAECVGVVELEVESVEHIELVAVCETDPVPQVETDTDAVVLMVPVAVGDWEVDAVLEFVNELVADDDGVFVEESVALDVSVGVTVVETVVVTVEEAV